MDDERQKALERQRDLVRAGKPLPPEEVDEGIHCIRDEIIVELRDLLKARKYKEAKDLMKLFNVAQPAVERYELMHGSSDTGSVKITWDMPKTKKWTEEQETKFGPKSEQDGGEVASEREEG